MLGEKAITVLRDALAEKQDENTVQPTGNVHSWVSDRTDSGVEIVTDCHEKEGDKVSPPLKSEACEYPRCLSSSGCERQCPAFPRCKDADTGKTSDAPETNFGNMAQGVDSSKADHIPDVTKMIEPLFWYRPRFDGLYEGPIHNSQRASKVSDGWVPLYPHPPKRKPLTYEEAKVLTADCLWSDMMKFVRAIERAHGIGGEK